MPQEPKCLALPNTQMLAPNDAKHSKISFRCIGLVILLKATSDPSPYHGLICHPNALIRQLPCTVLFKMQFCVVEHTTAAFK